MKALRVTWLAANQLTLRYEGCRKAKTLHRRTSNGKQQQHWAGEDPTLSRILHHAAGAESTAPGTGEWICSSHASRPRRQEVQTDLRSEVKTPSGHAEEQAVGNAATEVFISEPEVTKTKGPA